MDGLRTSPGIADQVDHSIELWQRSAGPWFGGPGTNPAPHYTPREQRAHEQAYDLALRDVERHARQANRFAPAESQKRLVASFARFAATALDLDDSAVTLITESFLPVGIDLARWARRFDPSLSTPDIVQACRNAWTACGLQPLLGAQLVLTPAILGYSLLYPYSDNFLDQRRISRHDKLRFSERFRSRLRGEPLLPHSAQENSIWELVHLIESQFPRSRFPDVFESLLAIHNAQEESLAQLHSGDSCDEREILRISCLKGGTSVLADAFLVHGVLTRQQYIFAFDWGVLLQLGDDLQDVHEDLERGSATLFTRAVHRRQPLDNLALQLLNLGDAVAGLMDALPHGAATHKALLRMSWRTLVLMAVAQAQPYFSPALVTHLEPCSPFRFGFLRARRKKLEGRSGLFQRLFQILLSGNEAPAFQLPSPRPVQRFPIIPPVARAPDLTT
jgi:hypothetical protein